MDTKQGDGTVVGTATWGYRGPYLVAEHSYANGLSGTRTFDAARRPLVDQMAGSSGATVFSESLSWSPRSLKVAQSRGDVNGTGWVLRHDGARRLAEATRQVQRVTAVPNNSAPGVPTPGAPETHQYQYDTAQNLTASTRVTSGVAETTDLPADASGRNRPASVNGLPLTWDANGNLTAKGDLRLAYDFRNRLTEVRDSGGSLLASYTYDAFNRRVERQVGGTTHETTWSGWQAVEERVDGQLHQRRVYGRELDEVVALATDLDGDGVLETQHTPIYDSTGNVALLTGPSGQVIERYVYDPFGRREVFVDSTPPEVQQLRIEGGTLVLEISEAVSREALEDALTAGLVTLTETVAGTDHPLTATLPVEEGPAAHRRVILTPTTSGPAADVEVTLTVDASALRDFFGHEAAAGFSRTFLWPSTDTVLLDTAAPELLEVVLRAGIWEVTFTEPLDAASVASLLTVDSTPATWQASADLYSWTTTTVLPAGSHTLEIGAVTDLAGTALVPPSGETLPLTYTDTAPTGTLTVSTGTVLFRAQHLEGLPTSTAGNPLGFQGHPVDPETGFLYLRNRYYDPELGRFITPDPLGYVDGPSMYGFAGYGPLDFGDPLGLCAFGYTCKEALGIAGDTLAGAYQDVVGAVVGTGVYLVDTGVDAYQHVREANATFDAGTVRRRQNIDDPGVLPTTLHSEELAAISETFSHLGAAVEDAGRAAFSATEAGSYLSGAGGMITIIRNGFLKRVLRSEADEWIAKGWKPLVDMGEEVAEAGVRRNVPRGAAFPRFTQSTASSTFRHGPFRGRSIGDVAEGLRSGNIQPSQLPVDVIVRDGQTLALNTRSMLALRRAGIDPGDIFFRDVTGDPLFERILDQRLLRNQLTNSGTDVVRITGAGPNASNLR